MTTALTETNTYSADVQAPVNGEPRTIAGLRATMTDINNRVVFLKAFKDTMLSGKITTNGAGGFTYPAGGVGVGWTATISTTAVRVTFATVKANDDYAITATIKEINGVETVQYAGETTAKVDFTFHEEVTGAMQTINASTVALTFGFIIVDG